MAAWHADPIYLSKLNPNTGYFNAYVDRNDDLIKLPAIQIAEAGTHLPNRDYLAIINNDLSDIVFKLYNDGKFELSDGSAFTTVLDSSNDLSSVSDTDLISAKAALAAIDAAIASNDTIDSAARTAVETAMSAITDALTASLNAEVTRATAAEASLQAEIDNIPTLITTAISSNDVLDTAARNAVTAAFEAADISITSDITDNTNLITAETARATAAEAALQAEIDNVPSLITTAISANDILDSAAREAVTTAFEAADDELTTSINTLIAQALPSSSMFIQTGTDYVITGFLVGHTGGSLIEVSSGDIIFPTAPTGFPESSFILSEDNTEIIFGG